MEKTQTAFMQSLPETWLRFLGPWPVKPGKRLAYAHWTAPRTAGTEAIFCTGADPGLLASARAPGQWGLNLLPDAASGVQFFWLANALYWCADDGAREGWLVFAAPDLVLGEITAGPLPKLFARTGGVEETPAGVHLATPNEGVATLRCFAPAGAPTRCFALALGPTLAAAEAAAGDAGEARARANFARELEKRDAVRRHYPDNLDMARMKHDAWEALVFALGNQAGHLCLYTNRLQQRHLPASDWMPLLSTWAVYDVAVARDLLLGLMARQQEDGRIPDEPATDQPCRPIVSQYAEIVCRAAQDQDLLAGLLPHLTRYLEWSFTYYDPDNQGRPHWRQAAESLLPEIATPGSSTPDISTCLLSEIRSFLNFTSEQAAMGPFRRFLVEEEGPQSDFLLKKLWREDLQAFRGLDADGIAMTPASAADLLPLALPNLPHPKRQALLKQLTDAAEFGGSAGLPAQPGGLAARITPAPVQAFMLAMFTQGGNEAAVLALESRLLHGLRAQYAQHGSAGDDWNAGAPAPTQWSPAAAALLMLVTAHGAVQSAQMRNLPAWVRWMDRNRLRLAIGGLLLFIAVISAISIGYARSKRMPRPSAEAMIGIAKQQSRAGNHTAALAIYEQLAASSSFATYNLLLANELMLLKEYQRAEQLYRDILQRNSQMPQAHMNLAQALYQQGRKAEARAQYLGYVENFKRFYPVMAEKATLAAQLIEQQMVVEARVKPAPLANPEPEKIPHAEP